MPKAWRARSTRVISEVSCAGVHAMLSGVLPGGMGHVGPDDRWVLATMHGVCPGVRSRVSVMDPSHPHVVWVDSHWFHRSPSARTDRHSRPGVPPPNSPSFAPFTASSSARSFHGCLECPLTCAHATRPSRALCSSR